MQGRSVLIVDDDSTFRNTLNLDLSRQGFKVSGASSGARALELFPDMKFDLIFASLEMSGGNGLELLKRLRADKIEVPVILVTSNTALKEPDAQKRGATALIFKPYRAAPVLEKLALAFPVPPAAAAPAGNDFAYFLNVKRTLVVVSWTGELKPTDAAKVQACVNEVVPSKCRFVVLNFHGFTGYDAVLAAELVRMQQRFREMPARLILSGLEPDVQKKLASNGLVKESEIVPTLKEALQFALSTGLAS